MPRVNYRDVKDRFTHINAPFVRCEFSLPDNDGFYAVSVYPWWEHPQYVEAKANKSNWGFDYGDEAYKTVTVYPMGLRQAHVSQLSEVTDWGFTQEHPLLWQYEESAQIVCNEPLSLERWMQISQAAQKRLNGQIEQEYLAKYVSLEMIHRWGGQGSFTLGSLPRPLFIAVKVALDEHKVSYFAPYVPELTELPVLFLIHENDYIIADDFEVDVPEFVHKPEWFRPR